MEPPSTRERGALQVERELQGVLKANTKHISSKHYGMISLQKKPQMGQMSIADRGPPTPRVSSFIPIHFNYPVIPAFFPCPD